MRKVANTVAGVIWQFVIHSDNSLPELAVSRSLALISLSGSWGDLCFYMGKEREGFFVVWVNFGILAQAEFSWVLGQAAFTASRFWKAGSYNANSWLGCGNARLMKSIVEDPLALQSWWPSEISMSLLTPKTRPFFCVWASGGSRVMRRLIQNIFMLRAAKGKKKKTEESRWIEILFHAMKSLNWI